MQAFSNKALSWLWLLVRVYVGYDWLTAGLHKASDAAWVGAEAGKAITGFWMRGAGLLTAPDGTPIPAASGFGWYQAFLNWLVNINAGPVFSYIIVAGELLVGIGLILGFVTPIAAAGGALMNLNFMLAGTASTNPMLYTLEILLLLAWTNAGYVGVDRFVWDHLFNRRRGERTYSGQTA